MINNSNKTSVAGIGAPTSISFEKHYTPFELAERWKVSPQTIRRLFCREPGVLMFGSPETRFKRKRETMRIPASVAERIHAKLHIR